MSHSTEHTPPAAEPIASSDLLGEPQKPGHPFEPDVMDDAELVPEVVEIRLDYTKDAVQMAKGGCRRWK